MSTTKALKAATQIAIGSEVTAGTAVALTRRLVTKTATYREVEEQETFEGAMHGSLSRVTLAPVITRQHTEFDLPMEFTFEQALIPLLAGIDGSVTPTSPGSGDARLWTFACDPLEVAAPQTLTLEWVESNFAASITDAARKAAYGFCTGFELKGSDTGLPMLTCSLVARAAGATTKTSLDLPLDLTFVPNARTSITVNDAWADLGNTAVAGQIYGYTYKFGGYLRPGYYLDGRTTPDLSCVDYGPRVADLTLEMVLDPALAYATEMTKKAAKALRFVRLNIAGPAFEAPDAGLAHYLHVDGAYYHAPDSMAEHGKDKDGNVIVTVHLLSALDDTSGNDIAFALQNSLALADFF